jgi:hypothetical protein
VPGHEDARIRRGYELDVAARSDSAGGRPGRGVLESGFRILRALPDADQRRHVSSVAEIKYGSVDVSGRGQPGQLRRAACSITLDGPQ